MRLATGYNGMELGEGMIEGKLVMVGVGEGARGGDSH